MKLRNNLNSLTALFGVLKSTNGLFLLEEAFASCSQFNCFNGSAKQVG